MKQYLKQLVGLISLAGMFGTAWASGFCTDPTPPPECFVQIPARGQPDPHGILNHVADLGTLQTGTVTESQFYPTPIYFTDRYDFTINGNSDDMVSARFEVAFRNTFETGVFLSDNTGKWPYPAAGLFDYHDVLSAPTDYYNRKYAKDVLLQPGVYSLGFVGAAGETPIGGSGGYDFSLTLAPVPEPGEWMLLLGGLAIVAYAVRRHRTWADAGDPMSSGPMPAC